MMNNVLYFYDKIEKIIYKKKRKYALSQYNKFLKLYNLKDDFVKESTSNYSGYQCTPISLCNSLLEKSILNKEDKILDIGCGSGIFMCYLISKGFSDIDGIEIDNTLSKYAIDNIQKVVSRNKINCESKIFNYDFFDFNYIEDYNVFYVFNSFNSVESYYSFFEKIKKSYILKPRKIKIVFLYLNAISKKALNDQKWIKKVCTVIDKCQFCNMCIKFTVYETK